MGEEFEPVLAYFAWWDCPRAGICLLDGRHHYFASTFSEALDNYPPEFQLWPVPTDALEHEVGWQERWVVWRSSFDRGEDPPPIEEDSEFTALTRSLEAARTPPAESIEAVPEWKLDPNRSYAVGVPQHWVRWQLLDR